MSTRYVWEKYNAVYAVIAESCDEYINIGASSTINQQIWGEKTVYVGSVGTGFDRDNFSLTGVTSVAITISFGNIIGSIGDESTTCSPTNGYYKSGNYIYYGYIGSGFQGDNTATALMTSYTRYYRSGDLTQGSTNYGYISSNVSNTYSSNGKTGNYWYVYKGSDSIDPTAISYSTADIEGGNTLKISLTPANNTYGGTITYTYQRSTDNGNTWSTIATTTDTSYTDTIPTNNDVNSVTYRATAKDNLGFTSSTYTTGRSVAVINNSAPTISGSNADLGTFSHTKPDDYTYTISDEDGNTVTVIEKLDETVIRTYTPTLDETNTISFTDLEWMKVLNGNHVVTISADDGNGGTAIRTITFNKNVSSLSAMFNPPLTSDEAVEMAIENLTANLPDGVEVVIEVCNNALDDEPTWEDVTNKVLEGRKFAIANTTKTADNWAYNVRISVSRGTATDKVYLTSMTGFFA